jgi:pilus assembly protein CpaB
MKVKTWVPLVLAAVLGLIAAKLTRDSVSRGRAPAAKVELSVVVTAADSIQPGQVLTPAMLGTGQVTPKSVPTGAFASPDALVNRVVMTPLVKGQPVLESMLAPEGAAAGVQALIPPGMRAITLEVNQFSGLGGLLGPGCRVDIISVVRADDGSQQSLARTIVQNVEVRAVGRQLTSDAAGGGAAAPAAADGAAGFRRSRRTT